MSGRVVRSITNAKDIANLSDHSTSDNDIISDVDGNIYLKQGTNNYVKLSTTNDSEKTKREITNLKSSNTQLKKRVSDVETTNKDLLSRIEALEKADTTTE